MKYEAHITVEPTSMAFASFASASYLEGWKASVFEVDEVDGFGGKWFLSYGSDSRDEIVTETTLTNARLRHLGFDVIRVKVEQTLFDTKAGHEMMEISHNV